MVEMSSSIPWRDLPDTDREWEQFYGFCRKANPRQRSVLIDMIQVKMGQRGVIGSKPLKALGILGIGEIGLTA